MNILTISGNKTEIQFKVFRYTKKINARIIMEGSFVVSTPTAKLIVNNLLNSKLIQEEIKSNNLKYGQVINVLTSHHSFNSYHFDMVVNSVACGGEEYKDIVLLHNNTLKELTKYEYINPDQKHNLAIARHFMLTLPKAKHYACFDSAFHYASIPKPVDNLITKISYSNGLAYQYLCDRLPTIVDTKIVKKHWIVVYWALNSINICAIKNSKSSFGNMELEFNNKINERGLCNEVASQIARFATLAGGLNGIIFSGEVGSFNPEIRNKVIDKLEWLGISLSKKANNANKIKINKKDCPVKILVFMADKNITMLNQFMKRVL